MKAKIIMALTVSAVVFTNTPAYANCPSGVCEVEVNCTTGVVTYKDAPPRVAYIEPIIITPITPTHQVVIQTANGSFATNGSLEQVEQAVQRVINAPQKPQIDSCVSGGCNKVIVNATTGVVNVLPLSEIDIAQRQIDQQTTYVSQLEMSMAAKEVIIQPFIYSTVETKTAQVDTKTAITQETTTITTSSSTYNSVMVSEWYIEIKRLINQLLALIARLNE
jgi:hypothetical protein